MFGRSRPVVFNSYKKRRSIWRLPRWLVLLLVGMALGAAGVITAQQRYLPPRLTAEASQRLTGALEASDNERLRLADELAKVTKQLESTVAEKRRIADELAADRETAQRLRNDLSTAVAALPPDPRAGTVEVRAGRFTAQDGMLDYEVVLTRQRASGKPMSGVMQLVMEGESARGTPARVSLQAIAVSIDSHQIVRGSQPLPEGFRPRQTTIQVLDRAAGKLLGMRVILVSSPA
jgi:hypothetical protein